MNGSVRQTVRFASRYGLAKVSLLGALLRAKFTLGAALKEIQSQSRAAPLAICIHSQGGGIGDHIVIARFMRDLAANCEPFVFDVACANAASIDWIYMNLPGFRAFRNAFSFFEIASSYALALNLSHFVEVVARDAEKLKPFPLLSRVVDRISGFCDRNQSLISGAPYTFGDIARRAVFANLTRSNSLQAQAGVPYASEALPISLDRAALARFALVPGTYVTFHNGFDPAFVVSGANSTKFYPYFSDVIRRLKVRMPELKTVQLGISTSNPISGIDVNLTNATTLPEVAALISEAALHVDIDSGLAHLAATVGTPSVTLFGPTDADYFGYPRSTNLRPQFCGGCWWTNETWMDHCPRGFHLPPCMTSHDPGSIVDKMLEALDIARRYPIQQDLPVALPSVSSMSTRRSAY